MRNDTIRLLEAAQAVEGIDTVERLTDEVARAAERFGATSVSANLIVTPQAIPRPGILIGRRWREWSARCDREGLQPPIPPVGCSERRPARLPWSEAITRFGSRAAAVVMAACLETTGATEALVVPVTETDGALMSAAFSGDRLELDPEARSAFHLVGYHYATRGRELLQQIAPVRSLRKSHRQLYGQ